MIKYKLSIVIATLGGNTLLNVVKRIANWNYAPIEIILVIPKEVNFDETIYYNYSNVIFLRTKTKGQVQQRLDGFSFSKGEIVAQMDDDIILSHNSLTNLYNKIIDLGVGNAICPVYFTLINFTSIHKFDIGIKGFIKNVYYKLVYNAKWGIKRMGTITATGHAFGVDPDYIDTILFETDFLPGGLVISFRQDLINTNFFQFKGKAFCEDVINSILRKHRNTKQYFFKNAICLIDVPFSESTYNFVELKKIFEIRSYIINLLNRKKYYLYAYTLILFTRAIFSKIKKPFFNEN